MIRMNQMRAVSRVERIAFPIVIGILVNLLLPPVAPLITMLMLGNLFKEVLVTERLAKTAANEVMNMVIIVLTLAHRLYHAGRQVPHRQHARGRHARPDRIRVRHRLRCGRRQDH